MRKIALSALMAYCALSSIALNAYTENDYELLGIESHYEASKKDKTPTQLTSSSTTYDIVYFYLEDGQYCHCARWSDCGVVTIIGDTKDAGSQVVAGYDGSLISASTNYSYDKKKKYYIHQHPGGYISTYEDKQIMTVYVP